MGYPWIDEKGDTHDSDFEPPPLDQGFGPPGGDGNSPGGGDGNPYAGINAPPELHLPPNFGGGPPDIGGGGPPGPFNIGPGGGPPDIGPGGPRGRPPGSTETPPQIFQPHWHPRFNLNPPRGGGAGPPKIPAGGPGLNPRLLNIQQRFAGGGMVSYQDGTGDVQPWSEPTPIPENRDDEYRRLERTASTIAYGGQNPRRQELAYMHAMQAMHPYGGDQATWDRMMASNYGFPRNNPAPNEQMYPNRVSIGPQQQQQIPTYPTQRIMPPSWAEQTFAGWPGTSERDVRYGENPQPGTVGYREEPSFFMYSGEVPSPAYPAPPGTPSYPNQVIYPQEQQSKPIPQYAPTPTYNEQTPIEQFGRMMGYDRGQDNEQAEGYQGGGMVPRPKHKASPAAGEPSAAPKKAPTQTPHYQFGPEGYYMAGGHKNKAAEQTPDLQDGQGAPAIPPEFMRYLAKGGIVKDFTPDHHLMFALGMKYALSPKQAAKRLGGQETSVTPP